MDMENLGEAAPQHPPTRGRYIKKRALKNKALAVPFNEKDLKDFVSGFHKRKKKRRKEAHKQQEEALRRKRIDNRKKRKSEREFAMFGGDPPASDSNLGDNEDVIGDDEEAEQVAPVAGTTMYDNGDITVTVTTCEISAEEEKTLGNERHSELRGSQAVASDKKKSLPVTKTKSFKKPTRRMSRSKTPSKRDKKESKRSKRGR